MSTRSLTSRSSLLTAARTLLNSSATLSDADSFREALLGLQISVSRMISANTERKDATTALSVLSASATAEEISVGRRIAALNLFLQGLAFAGDTAAAAARARFLPEGMRSLTQKSGRPQLTQYEAFADGLVITLLPAAAQQMGEQLRAAISGFALLVQEKEQAHNRLDAAVEEAVAAEAALRRALDGLEQEARYHLSGEVFARWSAPLRPQRRAPTRQAA